MRTLLAIFACLPFTPVSAQHYYLFVGTYTSGQSKGIYVYDFDASNGSLTWVSNTDSASNPSFLTVAPDGKHIYAVNEVSRQQTGYVAAYGFDPSNGKLSFINRVPSGSENPCHVSITKDGKWLAVANYSGGSLAVLPVNTDGSVAPLAQHIVHTGKGTNPQRQEKPHVHSVFFSPDEKYLLSPDLGLDRVYIYQFDKTAASPLTPAKQAYAECLPGTGPRHLEFSANGKKVYLVEELGGAVTVFDYQDGVLTPIQHMVTHLTDYKGQPGSADIHLSPDGKFLYASNRGEENNIAVFDVSKPGGYIKMTNLQPSGGEQPRNFMIDPTGNYLLAAHQKTGNIVVFKRNKSNGSLTKVNEIEVPNAVCLKMLKR